MSISPQIAQRVSEVTKRCRNCPRMFKTRRSYQHFCSAKCRKEFFDHNNTGFGRVKAELDNRLRKVSIEIAAIDERLTILERLYIKTITGQNSGWRDSRFRGIE